MNSKGIFHLEAKLKWFCILTYAIAQFSHFCFTSFLLISEHLNTFCYSTLKGLTTGKLLPVLHCNLRALFTGMLFYLPHSSYLQLLPCVLSDVIIQSVWSGTLSQNFPFDWSAHFTESLHLWAKRISRQLCFRYPELPSPDDFSSQPANVPLGNEEPVCRVVTKTSLVVTTVYPVQKHFTNVLYCY